MYRIGLTQRAEREIQRIDDWWRTHRPLAAKLFAQELDVAFTRICRQPGIGRKTALRHHPQARVFTLRKTAVSLIYNVEPQAKLVAVARVRHARRRPLEIAKHEAQAERKP